MRRTRAAACAVTVVALLVGCSGEEAGAHDSVGGTVTVLAASSLAETFTELAGRFERRNPGTTVQLSFAASSELATQVTNGAPADVFASASRGTMDQVVEADGAAGEPVVFARNRLEIAVPPGNPGRVRGLADLADEDLKVALCAPEVPCGVAAVDALDAAGVIPSPDTLEADVKAAVTKVALGEVDAALVYRTDVLAAGNRVEGVEVPTAAGAVNDYPIVVLSGSGNPGGAQAFVDLVLSRQGRAVLTAAGFERP